MGTGDIDIQITKLLQDSLTSDQHENMIRNCRLKEPRVYGRGLLERHRVKDVGSLYMYMKLKKHVVPETLDFDFLVDIVEKSADDEETVEDFKQMIDEYKNTVKSKRNKPQKTAENAAMKRPNRLSVDDASGHNGKHYSVPDDNIMETELGSDGIAATNFDLRNEAYAFNGNQLVVIINNFTKGTALRKGTDKDYEGLRDFINGLSQYGVYSEFLDHQDLNKNDMVKTLDQAKRRLTEHRYDRLMVFILSHGSEDAVIGYYDQNNTSEEKEERRNPLKIDKIYEIFQDSLPGRPKLFFMVSCNGSKLLERVHGDSIDETEPPEVESVYSDHTPFSHVSSPKRADMLFSCAAVKGHKSFRSPELGTWYVRHMIDVFEKRMKSWHVVDMITQIQAEVSQRRGEETEKSANGKLKKKEVVQMPYYQSTLRKPVFLLPHTHR